MGVKYLLSKVIVSRFMQDLAKVMDAQLLDGFVLLAITKEDGVANSLGGIAVRPTADHQISEESKIDVTRLLSSTLNAVCDVLEETPEEVLKMVNDLKKDHIGEASKMHFGAADIPSEEVFDELDMQVEAKKILEEKEEEDGS